MTYFRYLVMDTQLPAYVVAERLRISPGRLSQVMLSAEALGDRLRARAAHFFGVPEEALDLHISEDLDAMVRRKVSRRRRRRKAGEF